MTEILNDKIAEKEECDVFIQEKSNVQEDCTEYDGDAESKNGGVGGSKSLEWNENVPDHSRHDFGDPKADLRDTNDTSDEEKDEAAKSRDGSGNIRNQRSDDGSVGKEEGFEGRNIGERSQTVNAAESASERDKTLFDRKLQARAELFEFVELFPEVAPSDLPEEVKHSELPLAAAYALYEKREARRAEKAKAENHRNAVRSAGGIRSDTENFYTADEVRRMTRDEVRANYTDILRSMQKWHS